MDKYVLLPKSKVGATFRSQKNNNMKVGIFKTTQKNK